MKCESTRATPEQFKSLVCSTGTMFENDADAILNSESAAAVNPLPDPSLPPPSTSAECGPESVISVPDSSLPALRTSAGCEPELVIAVPDSSLPPPSTSFGCEPKSVISVADPSVLSQPSISTGCEENSPPSVPAPDQTPCESIEATADQCNITSDEPRSRVLSVAAQLNEKDSGLLVINKLGMKLDGIVRNIQPKQEVSFKWRKYSFKTKLVCYRCGHRSHIHYYCNCNHSNDGFR